MPQGTKQISRKKRQVYWIIDKNVSESRLTMGSKKELLEYIDDNILDVLNPMKEEQESYTIGVGMMTNKQLDSLPDIDD